MSRQQVLSGLDIGSTAVRLVVAERMPGGAIQVVAAVSVPAEGVNRGVITSLEDATASISAAKEKVERMTGLPIEELWVGISGPHILTTASRGVVAVGRANGEIQEADVERALEAARAVASPPNYEILHAIPKSFTIDSQPGVKDPIGMSGIRLEVETTVIQVLSTQLRNVMKGVYRAGFRVSGIILSVLAAAESHATERQRELGVVVVNIGGATTSVVVFEEGNILTAAVLPIGSEHITNDIAIGLRTSLDIAEEVKLHYGTALAKDVNKREEIDLSEFGAGEGEIVSRRYVAEIIEARMEEILDQIDAILKKVERSGMLPAGVVFVGGGVKIPGLLTIAKSRLRLPATLGVPNSRFMSAIEAVNDLSFATALGLVLWGDESSDDSKGRLGDFFSRFGVGGLRGSVKRWFKSFIP
ncbi:cell division protein FtsA [Candidatus Uhrbacteria bacterium RIFCSPLOWO2_12_FULL_46_10]|uniref:Cell division protein FtsA n=1 Tax=Candidatus Uhrbacteria bacterium RIFCSPLOWO2_01_FULL_47_25 TaxID=1802402 RepID=A0A1F7UYC6_9BACT|nr:MAG: Cell division protein ftsA [Parcubacteria group bacterium GW2011_GWA2_46_9]OGL60372.1 MAG: cell division protein FtsA [Candidatus Uhrbacteria bacterium RIFCSPHIGHO2_01_FULL_46_23]OGL69773.1 MAG: cell division protein FtsA [Candidatus Uhrbacteria bacterium RIFCSPHIGHO2_02_FULL_47_29]OGL75369.1 MAG: cell division protein FtsA [Candidatus Uhrbacteria bacterium RIFCSPHIGHO2_12_FULL_46_13]OGL82758.1 MAG: cell division protein FtsA [Candidatus Uhrbacteria bacterium RIFCSPLOWO2_01_FULL_47_25]